MSSVLRHSRKSFYFLVPDVFAGVCGHEQLAKQVGFVLFNPRFYCLDPQIVADTSNKYRWTSSLLCMSFCHLLGKRDSFNFDNSVRKNKTCHGFSNWPNSCNFIRSYSWEIQETGTLNRRGWAQLSWNFVEIRGDAVQLAAAVYSHWIVQWRVFNLGAESGSSFQKYKQKQDAIWLVNASDPTTTQEEYSSREKRTLFWRASTMWCPMSNSAVKLHSAARQPNLPTPVDVMFICQRETTHQSVFVHRLASHQKNRNHIRVHVV